MSQNQKPQGAPEPGPTLFGSIAFFAGFLFIFFALVAVINTAFQLDLAYQNVKMPKHWDGALGVVGMAALWWIAWAILTLVGPIRRFGRRRPWIMALIIIGILVGAIVGITIVDNQRIAERNKRWEAEDAAYQDSIMKVLQPDAEEQP